MALTARQEKALQALLTQPTVTAAAKQAGCDERSLRRYLKQGEFVQAYRDGQRQCWQETCALLVQGSLHAAVTLRQLMQDPSQPAAVRLRAACALLDLVNKHLCLNDLEQRLAALEAQKGSHAQP